MLSTPHRPEMNKKVKTPRLSDGKRWDTGDTGKLSLTQSTPDEGMLDALDATLRAQVRRDGIDFTARPPGASPDTPTRDDRVGVRRSQVRLRDGLVLALEGTRGDEDPDDDRVDRDDEHAPEHAPGEE
jgi:hypothetical protein